MNELPQPNIVLGNIGEYRSVSRTANIFLFDPDLEPNPALAVSFIDLLYSYEKHDDIIEISA